VAMSPWIHCWHHADGTLLTLAAAFVHSSLRRLSSYVCCADPTGRFGKKQTAGFDDRFCVDPDNPTVRAATGFPMCIPRSNPADGDDPLCPVRSHCQT
jgi:hypothetical protein